MDGARGGNAVSGDNNGAGERGRDPCASRTSSLCATLFGFCGFGLDDGWSSSPGMVNE